MSNEDIFIGIDNALRGGIAAISAHHGLIIAKTPMPTKTRTHDFTKTKLVRRKGKREKLVKNSTTNEIDAVDVVAWIKEITQSHPCAIAIEECPEHAQQKSAMRSMALNYGILIGGLSVGLPDCRIIVVRSGNPKDSWQRAMLPGCAKGETKAAALAAASRRWPHETWLASSRSKVPHDGMVDAALIAEFARLENL